jgi:hypothetical protein
MVAGPIHLGQFPDHGVRLTQAEYERRISALHSPDSPMPPKQQEEALRRAEMDLLIDYHLGVDFPSEKRALLLQEQQKMNRRFLWRLLASVLSHPHSPSDGLARAQVRAFGQHLSDYELAALLDLPLEDVARLKS